MSGRASFRRSAWAAAVMLAALASSGRASADEGPATGADPKIGNVRPMFGFGYSNTYGGGTSGWGYQAGARAQILAGSTQSFGLEASYVVPSLQAGARYVGIGVVLEQRVWDAFIASIGTVGYVSVTGPSRQPFGIVTNLGYSPRLTARLRAFVTYRAEWIFASPAIGII